MLIKLYTNKNDIVLIEGVTDVCIKEGLREYAPWAALAPSDGFQTYFFDEPEQKPTDTRFGLVVREITFAKGAPCKLYLMNRAYVCNDDGRTVHVVDTGPNPVAL